MSTTKRRRYFGRCRACGDEWTERTPPAICPECHSLDVVDVTAEREREHAEHDGWQAGCSICEREHALALEAMGDR